MPNPWDNDPIVGSVGQPAVQRVGTPDPYKTQSQQQDLTKGDLDIRNKQLEIEARRLEIENKRAGTEAAKTGVEQGKAAGFYSRATDANKLYEGLGVGAPSLARETAKPILPEGIVNNFTDAARQQAEAAQSDFIAATLRYESGAAIPPEEMEAQRRRYFPVAGDSEETIRLKAKLRQNAIAALQLSAGDAAKNLPQAPATGEGGSSAVSALTPEQQKAYAAFVAAHGGKPDAGQLQTFLEALTGKTLTPGNAEQIAQGMAEGRGYSSTVEDVTRQQKIDERAAEMGQNAGVGTALKGGIKDTLSLGFGDEIQAGVEGVAGALRGEGSFGDIYSTERDANRIYQRQLQSEHPYAYMGGQIIGGAALPVGRATSAIDLAKAGAAYGGAYGVGSGEDAQSRLTGGVEGAAAGGALGYLIPKGAGLLRKEPQAVPPLVDPKTLELNSPLDAMSPAQRYGALKDAGVNNPPMAATGGRTARIIDQGLTNLPPSAGIMEDAASPIARDIRNGADKVASQFGSARSQNDIGNAVQKGLGSWIAKMKGDPENSLDKGLIDKAYDVVPIQGDSPASTGRIVSTLTELTQKFADNPGLQEQLGSKQLRGFLDSIQANGLTWDSMKRLRSYIGERIGERMFTDDATTGELRAVYAALSEDMRQTATEHGPRALQTFERANALNKAVEGRIEGAFIKLLGPDAKKNPEAAAQALQKMTSSKGGDLRSLTQIYSSMKKSGDWNEVAAGMIRLGGLPSGGEGRAWNPQTFVNWYSDMSEPARKMIFGKADLRKSLDGFVAANQQLARVKALSNTSQTTPTFLGAQAIRGVAGGAGAAVALTNPLLAAQAAAGTAAAAGLNYAFAKMWTWPKFVRWATGYSRAIASGNGNAVKSQIGRLQSIAATNPELREPLVALQQKLLDAANDNAVSGVAASPDSGDQNNNQQ